MRVYIDLGGHDPTGTSSGRIIKYDKTPDTSVQTTLNGHYVLEIPEGSSVVVDGASYIFPQNASSIGGKAAQDLLVRYPMYDHALYNFLLDNSDISSLDLGASVPHPTSANTTPALAGGLAAPTYSRCKTGRSSGPGPVGMAPNRTAILSRSFTKAIDVYGSVVSKNVDITSYNPANPGTDEVLVWWRISKFNTTQDVKTLYGTGTDTPALNSIEEIAQEPFDFSVWVSNDNGVSWYETSYLEPVDLVSSGKDIRIAFVNQGDDPLYLLGYCILFPDLP